MGKMEHKTITMKITKKKLCNALTKNSGYTEHCIHTISIGGLCMSHWLVEQRKNKKEENDKLSNNNIKV